MVKAIDSLPSSEAPHLYFDANRDLQGVGVGRRGPISILSIYVPQLKEVYLVDVHTLQKAAFKPSTPTEPTTLLSILEDPVMKKVFFDVRPAAEVFHDSFRITLRGVEDVQLMENALRATSSQRQLDSLEACILRDAETSNSQRTELADSRERVTAMLAPEEGGSRDVIDKRPLSGTLARHCALGIQYLPVLREKYLAELDEDWRDRVRDATEARLWETQAVGYFPDGEWEKRGPWDKWGCASVDGAECSSSDDADEGSFSPRSEWAD